MARFARTRGKRYYRKRRVLAKSNIYARKSASAQARQISALNKRISRVYRMVRPEAQRDQTSESWIFKNDTFADTYNSKRLTRQTISMVGNWTNLHSVNIRGLFEYSDNYQIDAAVDHQRCCSARLLVWQAVKCGGSAMSVTDILMLSGSGSNYELNTIRPLKNGVTSIAKILYDKTVLISNASPIKRFRINLKRLLNLHKESDQSYPRGDIYFAVVTSGLYWDSTYNQQIKVTWVSDVYLSDQN